MLWGSDWLDRNSDTDFKESGLQGSGSFQCDGIDAIRHLIMRTDITEKFPGINISAVKRSQYAHSSNLMSTFLSEFAFTDYSC